MRPGSDLVLADRNQILGPADHAGRRAADLNMCHRANRLQLEHEVERRDLKHADVGHAQHVGDGFNRRTTQPAFLLLRAPQQRDNRAGLAPFGVLGDLRFGPLLVGSGEGKAFGLLGVKTAKHR